MNLPFVLLPQRAMYVLLRPSLAVMLMSLFVEIRLDHLTSPGATRHLVSLER